MKRSLCVLLLLALTVSLFGCRVRTTLIEPESVDEASAEATSLEALQSEAAAPDAEGTAAQDENSDRREFAADASGELTPEAETPLYVPADEPAGAAFPGSGEFGAVNAEAEGAELTATETISADEAERLGADDSGEVADSVLTYYLTLLDSRLGSLFECKRLNVYWETGEDHRTIHKSSVEHRLILGAGAYDVSAKLLEENLKVDDGWVFRKNPDAVVKVIDGGAMDAQLAEEACSELAARSGWAEVGAIRDGNVLVLSGRLLETQAGRTAAMVYLAKLMYPDQMEDVDADEALRALTEEAEGSAYIGLYAYAM